MNGIEAKKKRKGHVFFSGSGKFLHFLEPLNWLKLKTLSHYRKKNISLN